MRALAQLGVIHEPDFSEPVDMTVQLMLDGAPQAVEDHGPALLGVLHNGVSVLDNADWHTLMTADKPAREALMEHLNERATTR